MRKKASVHTEFQNCSICSATDKQVICILDKLVSRMKQKLEAQINQSNDTRNTNLQEIDFQKMIKMLFAKKFKNLKATTNCAHDSLKKTFTKQLSISNQDLDRLSSILAWRFAKFNFHIDVVILQSKSFLRHLNGACNGKYNQKSVQYENFDKRKDRLKIKSHHKNKNQKSIQVADKGRQSEQDIEYLNDNNDQIQRLNCLNINNQGIKDNKIILSVNPWQWPTHIFFPNINIGTQSTNLNNNPNNTLNMFALQQNNEIITKFDTQRKP